MCAVISSRKPFYVEANTTTLEVKTRTWYSTETEPTTWDYEIIKTSYEVGVAEDLSIDVSPFIMPKFEMTPQANPTNITPILDTEWLNVKLEVNGVEETHNAVNGYVSPLDESYYDHWQVTKAIHYDTDSQLSLPPGNYTVTWTTGDGQVQFETVSSTIPVTARVANTGLDLTTANTLVIDTGFYQYNYNIVCSYQDATIGFVNSKGMWEYFDVNGRQDQTWNRTDDTYTQYATGQMTEINVNGTISYKFNTGWVDEEFRRVMSEFMYSEYRVWSYGDTWGRMVLDSKSMLRQNKKNQKMINYSFNCTMSSLVIPSTPGQPVLFEI